MMRVSLLLGMSAIAALSGCAVLYSYGDYQDGQGGSGTSGTTGGGGTCTEASQCPGEDTECSRRACNSGVCGVERTPEGTETAKQVRGDCITRVCDGEGNAVDQPDDDDTPRDGNECSRGTCEGGTPGQDFVPGGEPCGEGDQTRCDGEGNCVGCRSQGDCPPSDDCVAWTCSAAGRCTPSNTPADEPCGESSCLEQTLTSGKCDGNGACMETQQDCTPYLCSNNTCGSRCATTSECAPGYHCDDDACRDCLTCGEWLDAPGPLEGRRVCDSSIELVRLLRECACNEPCAAICGDGCMRNAFTGECAACVQESCPEVYTSCGENR